MDDLKRPRIDAPTIEWLRYAEARTEKAEAELRKFANAVPLPLADAQMLLSWMDETFGNDSGTDWLDEDAAAVGDALNKAIENFKRMRAACGVRACGRCGGRADTAWCCETEGCPEKAAPGVALPDGGQR